MTINVDTKGNAEVVQDFSATCTDILFVVFIVPYAANDNRAPRDAA